VVEALTPDPARRSADINFGNAIRLTGYSVAPATPAPGAPITITLYWQAIAPIGEDWTSFVQVINAAGDKVGQSDHRPGGEYYPTRMWAVNEELRDRHTLTIAPDPGSGPYRLLAGLYAPSGEGLRYLGEPQFIGELD
jgi:hypothetical protein